MKVLLVDDESIWRNINSTLLARISKNITTLIAESGEDAVELLKLNPDIDLVITDMDMTPGGMSGIDVLHHLKREYSHIPCILCSGSVYDLRIKDRIFRPDAVHMGYLSAFSKNEQGLLADEIRMRFKGRL